jgi:hypothetical protein
LLYTDAEGRRLLLRDSPWYPVIPPGRRAFKRRNTDMRLRFASFLAASLFVAIAATGCGTDEDFYVTPDTTPPLAPVILGALDENGVAGIWWEANAEPDLHGYYVYLRHAGEVVHAHTQVLTTNYISFPLPGDGVEVWVTALDFTGNESSPSGARSISFTGSPEEHPPTARPEAN